MSNLSKTFEDNELVFGLCGQLGQTELIGPSLKRGLFSSSFPPSSAKCQTFVSKVLERSYQPIISLPVSTLQKKEAPPRKQ